MGDGGEKVEGRINKEEREQHERSVFRIHGRCHMNL